MLNIESLSGNEGDERTQQTGEDDRRQLQLVAKGDETAFAQLYARYNTKVFNYILRLIHERSVAEDLLQETFIAVWKGASQFRGRSSVKTWIFRIAHNQSVSWLRKNAGNEYLEDVQLPAIEWQVDDNLMVEWQAEQIVIALEQLAPNHRAVVELLFVHQLSYAEIAQVMDCPVGTVKSRVSYALKHLSHLLQMTDLGR